jgi:hypothetical protein
MTEVAEAEDGTEQGAVSVTVEMTVITQEAGHVLGHAAANGENAMAASANVRIQGDIMDRMRLLSEICIMIDRNTE